MSHSIRNIFFLLLVSGLVVVFFTALFTIKAEATGHEPLGDETPIPTTTIQPGGATQVQTNTPEPTPTTPAAKTTTQKTEEKKDLTCPDGQVPRFVGATDENGELTTEEICVAKESAPKSSTTGKQCTSSLGFIKYTCLSGAVVTICRDEINPDPCKDGSSVPVQASGPGKTLSELVVAAKREKLAKAQNILAAAESELGASCTWFGFCAAVAEQKQAVETAQKELDFAELTAEIERTKKSVFTPVPTDISGNSTIRAEPLDGFGILFEQKSLSQSSVPLTTPNPAGTKSSGNPIIDLFSSTPIANQRPVLTRPDVGDSPRVVQLVGGIPESGTFGKLLPTSRNALYDTSAGLTAPTPPSFLGSKSNSVPTQIVLAPEASFTPVSTWLTSFRPASSVAQNFPLSSFTSNPASADQLILTPTGVSNLYSSEIRIQGEVEPVQTIGTLEGFTRLVNAKRVDVRLEDGIGTLGQSTGRAGFERTAVDAALEGVQVTDLVDPQKLVAEAEINLISAEKDQKIDAQQLLSARANFDAQKGVDRACVSIACKQAGETLDAAEYAHEKATENVETARKTLAEAYQVADNKQREAEGRPIVVRPVSERVTLFPTVQGVTDATPDGLPLESNILTTSESGSVSTVDTTDDARAERTSSSLATAESRVQVAQNEVVRAQDALTEAKAVARNPLQKIADDVFGIDFAKPTLAQRAAELKLPELQQDFEEKSRILTEARSALLQERVKAGSASPQEVAGAEQVSALQERFTELPQEIKVDDIRNEVQGTPEREPDENFAGDIQTSVENGSEDPSVAEFFQDNTNTGTRCSGLRCIDVKEGVKKIKTIIVRPDGTFYTRPEIVENGKEVVGEALTTVQQALPDNVGTLSKLQERSKEGLVNLKSDFTSILFDTRSISEQTFGLKSADIQNAPEVVFSDPFKGEAAFTGGLEKGAENVPEREFFTVQSRDFNGKAVPVVDVDTFKSFSNDANGSLDTFSNDKSVGIDVRRFAFKEGEKKLYVQDEASKRIAYISVPAPSDVPLAEIEGVSEQAEVIAGLMRTENTLYESGELEQGKLLELAQYTAKLNQNGSLAPNAPISDRITAADAYLSNFDIDQKAFYGDCSGCKSLPEGFMYTKEDLLSGAHTNTAKLSGQTLNGLVKASYLHGKKLELESVFRNHEENKAVGGASNSAHLSATAVDVVCGSTNDCANKARALSVAGFTGIGVGGSTLHGDMASLRSWPYDGATAEQQAVRKQHINRNIQNLDRYVGDFSLAAPTYDLVDGEGRVVVQGWIPQKEVAEGDVVQVATNNGEVILNDKNGPVFTDKSFLATGVLTNDTFTFDSSSVTDNADANDTNGDGSKQPPSVPQQYVNQATNYLKNIFDKLTGQSEASERSDAEGSGQQGGGSGSPQGSGAESQSNDGQNPNTIQDQNDEAYGKPTITCLPNTVLVNDPVTITWTCPADTLKSGGIGFQTGGAAAGPPVKVLSALAGTKEYTVQCINTKRTKITSDQCTVRYIQAGVAIDARPKTVEKGNEIEVGWATREVDSCVIKAGQTVIAREAQGKITLTPEATTKYTILCEAPTGKSIQSDVTVVVVPPSVDPEEPDTTGTTTATTTATTTPATSDSTPWIRATPSAVSSDEPVEISWDGGDVQRCTATAPNGDTVDGITGSVTTTGITEESIFSLSCQLPDDTWVVKRTSVNVL